MSAKKILIVDDEVDFGILVKRNLELDGDFEVAVATNGKAGINLAKKLKPDLILLDIMMPGIDGFEVLQRLKKDDNTVTIPVIMLSAKGDEASKVKAVQLYDDEYITKPIGASDLKAKIEQVLNRRGVE